MTGDARAEAERIVADFGVLSYDEGTLDGMGDEAGASNTHDEFVVPAKDRLVAALAAAIEVAEDGAPVGNDYTGEALVECNHQVWLRLRDALSALRARAGEETG